MLDDVFRFLSLGDVFGHSEQADRPARRIGKRLGMRVDPANLPIGTHQAEFFVEGRLVADCQFQVILDAGQIVGVDRAEEC